MNKAVLVLMCVLISGCAYFHPAPPLKESEIPYRLAPGIYTDTTGDRHEVTTNTPRWSVSEAYLYDAVVKPERKISWFERFINKYTKESLITIVIILVWVLIEKRRKKQ